MSLFKTIAAATVASVMACGGCETGDNGELKMPTHTPEATASHILVEDAELAEKIKQQIIDGELTFADAAKEHSTCPSKEQGGSLGQFEQGQMIPEFEAIIFDNVNYPIEQVHGPVETQFGKHLIWIESRLNADGSMDGFIPILKKATASHILVDEEEKCAELKKQIEESENPEMEFSVVAEAESKCPSGKQNGGSLGEFKQGQMVPEFEEVIFGEDYEMKKVHGPVKTQFGYHLIWIEARSGDSSHAEEKKEEDDMSTEAPSDEEPSLNLEEESSEVAEEEVKSDENCEAAVEEDNKHAEL